MGRFGGAIVIRRPVEAVFDFVADERNEPRYNTRMIAAELLTPEPIGVGARFHARMMSRRRPVDMLIAITVYERPRRLGSRTELTAMQIEGMLTFEPLPEGTRLKWAWNVQPRGWLRLLSPLVTLLGRRQEAAIWGALKRYLEAQPGAPPAV